MGANVGSVLGATEGNADGRKDGLLLGAVGLMEVGTADGFLDDGSVEGFEVGDEDGTLDGLRVGNAEGVNFGDEVGTFEGMNVGTDDGTEFIACSASSNCKSTRLWDDVLAIDVGFWDAEILESKT